MRSTSSLRLVAALAAFAVLSCDAPPPQTNTPASGATARTTAPAPTATAAATTAASAAASAAATPTTSATAEQPSAASSAVGPMERTPDIEYVPTPENVVDKMLEVANIQKTDVLYDLGCGDGRIVVAAAKRHGIKAFGYDIDPDRVKESRENVKKNGVENLVTIEQKDIFKLDLTPASVVTLYLLPELNVKLIPQLEKLKPGSRIVSHDFDMKGVDPDKEWTVIAKDHRTPKNRDHYVYLWTTPLKKSAKPAKPAK
jgi:SAM-dependent methyltransferase